MSKTYVIYKITCDSLPDYVYVGSTTNFIKRKCYHRDYSNKYDETDKHAKYKVYQIIRENGGWDNWSMVPVEEFKCDTIQQARIREQHWLEELKANMNSRNAFTDKRTYFESRRELKADYDAYYREVNAYRRKAQKADYYQRNKDEINRRRKERYNQKKQDDNAV